MNTELQSELEQLPVDQAKVIVEHLQISNRFTLSHRMHQMSRAVSFFEEIHRLLEHGYRLDEPSAALYRDEMIKHTQFMKGQVNLLNCLMMRILKTAEARPELLPEENPTCRN